MFKTATARYETMCRATFNALPMLAQVTCPQNQHCFQARFFEWQKPHRTQVCTVWLCRLYTAQVEGTPFTLWSTWQPCQRSLQLAPDSGSDPEPGDKGLASAWPDSSL